MFRILAALACVAVASETLGTETCAVAAGARPCAATSAGSDHSLLQVHPASTVAATKKTGPSGNETAKTIGTEIQQDEAVQHGKTQSQDKKVTDSLESKARTDPYPEDYNLDTDYPRDDKGTHADTIREVQSATLPGDGDVGRKTKPGLHDSWNVDTMFVTDSDGGGHVSLRDMIPWGYRSQTGIKESHEGKSGSPSEGTMSDNKDKDLQRHNNGHA